MNMTKSWTAAVMQFPMQVAKRAVEAQLEAFAQTEEYLKGLGLPPPMLFFWVEGLKFCKQAVQAPMIAAGHQEHYRH